MGEAGRSRRRQTEGEARPALGAVGAEAGARGGRRAEAFLRREVLAACRRLDLLQLIGGAEGNVSCRLPDGRFLMTPSGLPKGRLRPSDLVVVDGWGRRVRGVRPPTSELLMHLAVYEGRPDVGAAVHAHPTAAVALTVAGLPAPNDLVPEASVVLGEMASARFATPGTPEMPEVLKHLLPGHDVFLLERHGALTLGSDLAEAMERMEVLERVARIAALARLLGRCEPLSRENVKKVLGAAGKSPKANDSPLHPPFGGRRGTG